MIIGWAGDAAINLKYSLLWMIMIEILWSAAYRDIIECSLKRYYLVHLKDILESILKIFLRATKIDIIECM